MPYITYYMPLLWQSSKSSRKIQIMLKNLAIGAVQYSNKVNFSHSVKVVIQA